MLAIAKRGTHPMLRRIALLLVLVLAPTACAGTTPQQDAADSIRSVTINFGFIPNVQFAPFYVADSKGYYAEEGLEVVFDYNFETDVVQQAATWPESEVEFALGSGLSVLLARQQELPIMMTMLQYQQFPVVLFSKGADTLQTPEDLAGQSVGIPGRFGASYYGLQAILYASDMSEDALDIEEVGFNQLPLVLEDRIDVATGYAMNEPVKLREEGIEVSTLRVADYFPLVSDGILTSEQLLAEEPEVVRGFVRASLRGLRDTLDAPDDAFVRSLLYVGESEIENPEFERAVLRASLPFWEAEPLGASDPQRWEQTHQFLLDLGVLEVPLDVEEAYTNQFIAE
jgi:NitT/TauT family transport system substrate-binding protein